MARAWSRSAEGTSRARRQPRVRVQEDERIVHVPIPAQAGYASELGDPGFVALVALAAVVSTPSR